MKNKFKTSEGKEVNVIEWDEPNNIAYVKFPNGNKIWVGKKEYSTWESIGDSDVPVTKSVHIPDMPSQMTEEQAESVNYNLETDELKEDVDVTEEEIKPKRKYTKKQNL